MDEARNLCCTGGYCTADLCHVRGERSLPQIGEELPRRSVIDHAMRRTSKNRPQMSALVCRGRSHPDKACIIVFGAPLPNRSPRVRRITCSLLVPFDGVEIYCDTRMQTNLNIPASPQRDFNHLIPQARRQHPHRVKPLLHSPRILLTRIAHQSHPLQGPQILWLPYTMRLTLNQLDAQRLRRGDSRHSPVVTLGDHAARHGWVGALVKYEGAVC